MCGVSLGIDLGEGEKLELLDFFAVTARVLRLRHHWIDFEHHRYPLIHSVLQLAGFSVESMMKGKDFSKYSLVRYEEG